MQYKDYYQILGVEKSATHDEIRKAFRKLARKYHPDVAEDKTGAESKFKEINEAYEVLGDEEKRKKYDTLGAGWDQGAQPPPGWGRGGMGGHGRPGNMGEGVEFEFGGTGFSDFFEAFFGSQTGGRNRGGGTGWEEGFRGQSSPRPRKGADLETDLLVTMEEAMRGSTRIVTRRDPSGANERIDVKIPAGVIEGERIRVKGKGQPGANGGESGDLYLNVRFASHPDFRFERWDITHDLHVSPARAVLGGEVEVPTPEGRARIKLAPGSKHGGKLRLRGQGLRHREGNRGDLYVEILIDIPTSPTEAQKKLYAELLSLES